LKRLSQLSFPAILLAYSLSQAPVFAQDTFQDGISLYNASRYLEALTLFRIAVEQDLTNPTKHYYFALALAQLKEYKAAASEFQICYGLNPWGPAAPLCRQAIKQYTGNLPSAVSLPKETNLATGQSARETVAAPNAYQKPSSKQHANTIIRRQVAYEKANNQAIGETYATAALKLAERKAKEIRFQAQEQVDQVIQEAIARQNNPLARLVGQSYDQELVKAQTDRIKQEAEEAEKNTKQEFQNQADRYRSWSQARNNAVETVADNLEDLMDKPASHSGVKLQSVGTDLYVRNYTFTNTKPGDQTQDPSKAASMHTKRAKADPLAVHYPQRKQEDGNEPGKPTKIQKVVRGKVVRY
jgi:vacuolar-type H+-ATPase subunit H